MNEQQAQRHFDFCQTILYDQDCIDVYFDVEFHNESPYTTDKSQAFYKGANITDLLDWDKINQKINWKRVEEESRDE